MNIEYLSSIIFMIAWLFFRFLKNDLVEKYKKIIVIGVVFLIIFFAILLPEKSTTINYIAVGLFIGEGVYLKIKNISKKNKENKEQENKEM